MTLLNDFRSFGAVRKALNTAVGSPGNVELANLQGVALLLFCAAFADEVKGPLLTIFPDEDRMNLFEREMSWLLEQEEMSDRWELLVFPDYDVRELNSSPAAVRERRRKRLAALSSLYMGGRPERLWILSTAPGAARKTMPPDDFRSHSFTLRPGEIMPMGGIEDKLLRSGYQRKKMVEREGEYCIRGGMIDLYPAHSGFPVRIEMAGDTVEEVRVFNTESQRSSGKIEEILVCPCFEASVSGAADRGGLSTLRKDHRALVERGIHFDGAILYPDVFGAAANPLRDGWFDHRVVVAPRRCESERALQAKEMSVWLAANEFDNPDRLYENLYIGTEEETASGIRTVALEPAWEGAGSPALPVSMMPPLPLNLTGVAERLRKETTRGAVFVISKYKKRLDRFLEDENITVARTLEGDLQGGFSLGDGALMVFTDSEMFRHPPRQKVETRGRSKDRAPILAPEDIREGDYVVHVDHGIGIYEGIVQQKSGDGAVKDFFRIRYADGDTLFVPVEQINRIEKYIGAESALPRVYPLHSGRWGKVKQKVKKKVEELAAALFKLYSERERVRGFGFSGDNVFMYELSESFPYEETEDQARAITEVAADMEKPSPMDRLVYGDVGYGKTEVAVRAAFKAALDKKQVALLAPTTILAHQHGETFRERLARFPVTVDVLSRFRSPNEQKEILKRLAAGELDIVIGTHRLLSKDIAFKDLGLLIVDEEQRFGVKHKETLKMIRSNVDVLTLTATPIPRTMNMAMIGLRDFSMIETPPEDRKAVSTFIEEWNTNSLYIAIERELARGGQVYFVHNDIATIEKVKSFLENSFPKARLAVCHGRMQEQLIERAMIDFYNNEYDILVSTTIIENGLDIPNVNTLIVNAAENFGLAQLYQLRGRVGRSYRQSYAYFFHSPAEFLNEKARKRLEAIRDFSDLGSGFRLAMKDLEIRGAGNLLGHEQHGYITEVGFNLYCQMLAESVEKFKGIKIETRPHVEVELNADSYIPEDYIEDELRRTAFYKKFTAAAETDTVERIFEEIQDRCGPAPSPLRNFVAQVKIRILAPGLGVAAIKTHPHSGMTDITFRDDASFDRFRELPYPKNLSLEVVYLKDRVRLIHENMRASRVVREILDFIEFAAVIGQRDFDSD